jgi:hypothetical protein
MTPPSHSFSKPLVTHTYTRRPHYIPTTSPEEHVDDHINIDESHALSNQLQVHQGYNLHDRTTMAPPDRLVLAIVEPSNYQEASSIAEWQVAMVDELAALDRTSTWDIVPLPPHVVPIT